MGRHGSAGLSGQRRAVPRWKREWCSSTATPECAGAVSLCSTAPGNSELRPLPSWSPLQSALSTLIRWLDHQRGSLRWAPLTASPQQARKTCRSCAACGPAPATSACPCGTSGRPGGSSRACGGGRSWCSALRASWCRRRARWHCAARGPDPAARARRCCPAPPRPRRHSAASSAGIAHAGGRGCLGRRH
eukprot:COSAG01_NODE_810_length_13426_cov_7.873790_11_plen_190_part_00